MAENIKVTLPLRALDFEACPICHDFVLLRRTELNIFAFVLLLFLTFGIGAIIYAIIYLKRPKLYCILCGRKLR